MKYTFDGPRDTMVDALCDLIDECIRSGKCGTYDDWQSEIECFLRENDANGETE